MEKKTYKLYHGDTLMIWGKGTVVEQPQGFVFAAGTEALVPDVDFSQGGMVVEGAEAQTRLALEKIKSLLEGTWSSLEITRDQGSGRRDCLRRRASRRMKSGEDKCPE
jgi:enamine deaminase RidA (YjgF/YER057c/UK114 family)